MWWPMYGYPCSLFFFKVFISLFFLFSLFLFYILSFSIVFKF